VTEKARVRAPGTPRVSVVIPCYNAARYICATIETVFAQGEQDIEVIVVDDGSNDRSVELVRAGFPSVRVVEQANQGVAAARNHGVRMAAGEWIAFLDADDIWLPGKLAAQFAQLEAAAGCRMIYTAWKVWPSDAPRPDQACLAELAASAGDGARWQGPSGWIYPELLLDCVVWTSTVLAHRSLFDEIGVFDTTLRVGEDYDLWLRASRVTPILRVAHPYALYRIHPASITKSRPTDNYRARVIGRALEKWGMQSPDGQLANSKAVHQMLAKSWSDFAGAQYHAGDFEHAKRGARQALRLSGSHLPGWKVLLKAYAKAAIGASPKGKA
jgi:glycosyltransferase involved in cell wall biosynthesis